MPKYRPELAREEPQAYPSGRPINKRLYKRGQVDYSIQRRWDNQADMQRRKRNVPGTPSTIPTEDKRLLSIFSSWVEELNEEAKPLADKLKDMAYFLEAYMAQLYEKFTLNGQIFTPDDQKPERRRLIASLIDAGRLEKELESQSIQLPHQPADLEDYEDYSYEWHDTGAMLNGQTVHIPEDKNTLCLRYNPPFELSYAEKHAYANGNYDYSQRLHRTQSRLNAAFIAALFEAGKILGVKVRRLNNKGIHPTVGRNFSFYYLFSLVSEEG